MVPWHLQPRYSTKHEPENKRKKKNKKQRMLRRKEHRKKDGGSSVVRGSESGECEEVEGEEEEWGLAGLCLHEAEEGEVTTGVAGPTKLPTLSAGEEHTTTTGKEMHSHSEGYIHGKIGNKVYTGSDQAPPTHCDICSGGGVTVDVERVSAVCVEKEHTMILGKETHPHTGIMPVAGTNASGLMTQVRSASTKHCHTDTLDDDVTISHVTTKRDHVIPVVATPSLEAQGFQTFHRYYHVFQKGELCALFNEVGGVRVVEEFYDNENWCVVAKKVT